MKNLKENYYNRANDIMSRLLGEAPEDGGRSYGEKVPLDSRDKFEYEKMFNTLNDKIKSLNNAWDIFKNFSPESELMLDHNDINLLAKSLKEIEDGIKGFWPVLEMKNFLSDLYDRER